MAVQLTLTGKTALVTGASRGIGAAISRHLARAGPTVLLNHARSEEAARTLAQQIQSEGGKTHLIRADVSKANEVDALFGQIDRSHGGRIDILVCGWRPARLSEQAVERAAARADPGRNARRALVVFTWQTVQDLETGGLSHHQRCSFAVRIARGGSERL